MLCLWAQAPPWINISCVLPVRAEKLETVNEHQEVGRDVSGGGDGGVIGGVHDESGEGGGVREDDGGGDGVVSHMDGEGGGVREDGEGGGDQPDKPEPLTEEQLNKVQQSLDVFGTELVSYSSVYRKLLKDKESWCFAIHCR